MNTLLLLLASVGLSHIIVKSKIIQPVKDKMSDGWLLYLLNCYQCSGFYTGLSLALLSGHYTDCLFIGFAASLLSTSAAVILDKLTI